MNEGTASPTGAKYSRRRRLAIILGASVALWTPVVAAACAAM